MSRVSHARYHNTLLVPESGFTANFAVNAVVGFEICKQTPVLDLDVKIYNTDLHRLD